MTTLPGRNMIDFTAQKHNHVHVRLDVSRESVYYIRYLIRRYTRDGYHVHAAVNHNGRLLANVWGSDIYTQAARRSNY